MTTLEKPRKLPKLDKATIDAQERAAVHAALRSARTAQRRLVLSAQIVSEAKAAASPLRTPRDQAGLSLSLHDGLRAVHDVIGVSRAYFHAMRCKALKLTEAERGTWLGMATKEQIAERAEACGVPRVEDAAAAAPDLGEQVARAEARASYARIVRDHAVAELHTQGWTRSQIAERAGFDDSRVSQILADAQ